MSNTIFKTARKMMDLNGNRSPEPVTFSEQPFQGSKMQLAPRGEMEPMRRPFISPATGEKVDVAEVLNNAGDIKYHSPYDADFGGQQNHSYLETVKPKDIDPRNHEEALSVEGRARSMAVPTPGAGTMRDFLNPTLAAGRADSVMGSMRIPMSPGRRAIMDLGEQSADRAHQRDLERIRETPFSFGDGSGMRGEKYFARPMMEIGPDGTLGMYDPMNGRRYVDRPPQAPFKVGPSESVFQDGQFLQAPGAQFEKLDRGQVAVNTQSGKRYEGNELPDDVKFSPDGSALWDGEKWVQNPYKHEKTSNPGLEDGQKMVFGNKDYFWSSKYGTFLDETGAPVYEPPVNSGPVSFNDVMVLEYAKENGIRLPQRRTNPPARKPLGGTQGNGDSNIPVYGDKPGGRWEI